MARCRGAVMVCALVAGAGCGRVGFDAVGDGGPPRPGDAASPDAAAVVGDAMRDAPAPVVCGPAYQPVAGQTSRYRTGITGAFAEAEAACEADGGHLIVVDDAVEDAYAASFGQGWIGISDTAVEGVFRGVTGTALGYINYAAGEPNSTGSDEDCLETTGTGWNDLPCRLPRIGACECDGVAATSGAWCDTDLAATCGDCSTTCADLQVCTNQTCIF